MKRTEELREKLSTKFPLKDFTLRAGDHDITITTAKDVEELIDNLSSDEFNADERLPYWADIWHSAVALAAFIDAHPEVFNGEEILDLGCGLGLEGIAAARHCKRITFADYDSDALMAAELNVLQNGVDQNAAFQLLDFRDKPERQWKIIIAADIIYESRFVAPLLAFIYAALAPDGILIIAEPNRLVAEDFFAVLERKGFAQWYQQCEAVHDGRKVAVSIHCIARSPEILSILEG
jgi:ETFB lysine methyltransferase